jgi:hypothetical protein
MRQPPPGVRRSWPGHAEITGVLVSGTPQRSRSGALKQTYALFDERVPGAPALARPEALAELTRRYFTSRGPATVKDCADFPVSPLAAAVQEAVDRYAGFIGLPAVRVQYGAKLEGHT